MTMTITMMHLHPMLADVDGSAVGQFIEWFTKLLGWLIAAGLGVWMKVSAKSRERTIAPQPLKVQAETEFVTEREFREHRDHVNRKLEKLEKLIGDKFDALDHKRHESISALHNHISVVETRMRSETSAMEERISERFETGNSRMIEHDQAIARLDERTRKDGCAAETRKPPR